MEKLILERIKENGNDVFNNFETLEIMMPKGEIYIEPFDMKYVSDYYEGLNEEITKYQWPDPFDQIDDAKALLQDFLDEMKNEEMLFYAILSKEKSFIGSVEIHGLREECPELGVWITESEQKKGYAYYALKAALDYACSKWKIEKFYYEVDVRNVGSISLLHKFEDQYDILQQEVEELITDSGKHLKLQGYVLKVK